MMTVVTAPAPDRDAASSTAVQAPGSALGSAVALAQAVADAVREVAGVAGLSSGRGALAATYGPGKRVVGVVVERCAENQLRLEAHIIIAQRYLDALQPPLPSERSALRTPHTPILPALADQIRAAAISAAYAVGVTANTANTVDVFIDDIQS